MARSALWLAGVALVAFLLDQGSKWAVVEAMGLAERGRIDVAPPYLTFRMGWNTGINFGLFGSDAEGARWFLVALAVGISVVLAVWTIRSRRSAVAAGAGLVVGGALGNAWDRVTYGAVADFLNMSCCGIDNPYAFNLADVAIFLGVAVLVLLPEPRRAGG